MQQKLFQFAVLYHEKIDKGNQREEIKSSVLIAPETCLATDEKVALLQIAKKIPDSHQDKLQDIEILLRPF
jgi:hypothetical protein